jgi:hypothetical protein
MDLGPKCKAKELDMVTSAAQDFCGNTTAHCICQHVDRGQMVPQRGLNWREVNEGPVLRVREPIRKGGTRD